MLQESVLQAAVALAQDVTDKGFALNAEPGSPVAEIIGAGQLEYQLFDGTEQSLMSDSAMAEKPTVALAAANEAQMAQALSNNPFHDEKMTSATGFFAQSVTAHLDFACNTVLDAARGLTVQVQKAMQDYPEFASGLVIKQSMLPELLFNYDWTDELRSRSTGEAIRVGARLQVQTKSVQEIIEMCKTGSAGLDTQVLQYLASLSSTEIDLVYGSFFRSVSEMGPADEAIEEDLDVFLEQAETRRLYTRYAPLVYLIARSLFVNPEQGLQMSLAQSKLVCLDYMNLAAGYQLRAIELWQKDIQAKTVITHLDTSKNIAYVNKVNYGNYLNAGGSSDVVCGVIAMGNTRVSTAADLATVSDEAMTANQQYMRVNKAQSDNKRFDRFQAILMTFFMSDLKNMGEQESQMYKASPEEALVEIEKRARVFVNELSHKDTARVPHVCLEMTAKCRYFYTDAYRILRDIDDFCSDSSVKEAALKTVINLVTDFMIDQLYVKKIK